MTDSRIEHESKKAEYKVTGFKEHVICTPNQPQNGYNLKELTDKWDKVFDDNNWGGRIRIFTQNIAEQPTNVPEKILNVDLDIVSLTPLADKDVTEILNEKGYRLPTLSEILVGLENGLNQNGEYFIDGGQKIRLMNMESNPRDPKMSSADILKGKIVTDEKLGENSFSLVVVPVNSHQ